ncbi:TrmH family RNA methyltransferase [Leeia aquatica]|nr:RNA methyltransferase [Leeia aquatica]
MLLISSAANARFKTLKKLCSHNRSRQEARLMVLDGVHLLQSLLDCGSTPQTVVLSEPALEHAEIRPLLARLSGVETLLLSEALFGQLSELPSATGILALCPLPAAHALPHPHEQRIVLLDGVQDPGNVGSILRTAAAAGIDAVLLSPDCADPWSPKTLRAGMGAHFAVRVVAQADLLACLDHFKGNVVGTTLDAPANVYQTDLRGSLAWLFGAEGQGVRPALQARCTTRVRIPMPGKVESLNVAAAAAICLFEQLRQNLHP